MCCRTQQGLHFPQNLLPRNLRGLGDSAVETLHLATLEAREGEKVDGVVTTTSHTATLLLFFSPNMKQMLGNQQQKKKYPRKKIKYKQVIDPQNK